MIEQKQQDVGEVEDRWDPRTAKSVGGGEEWVCVWRAGCVSFCGTCGCWKMGTHMWVDGPQSGISQNTVAAHTRPAAWEGRATDLCGCDRGPRPGILSGFRGEGVERQV